MRILIIGYGQVGSHLHRTFPDASVADPPRGMRATGNFDVAFVCVPTDMREDGSADTSIVKSVIKEWSNAVDVFCIKSTVPPRTTEHLISAGYRVTMSPEFTGATQHSVDIDDGFVIIGGGRHERSVVAQAYKEVKPATFEIRFTDALTAELVKYGENAFLYTKVAFFNEFARICRAFGVDPDEWREALLLDPRIGRSHTFVYQDHPYVKSHCLSKDVPAIINASINHGYVPQMLMDTVKTNSLWVERGEL